MLERINEEREAAGVQPVVLGDNGAAQLHADPLRKVALGATGVGMD